MPGTLNRLITWSRAEALAAAAVVLCLLLRPGPASAGPTPTAAAPEQAQACALRTLPAPTSMGDGVVESFIDHATAQAMIERTQAQAGGKIDPDYVDNLRVAVRMDDGTRASVLIPKAMAVRVGDHVAVQSSYRNAQLPCNYIPNLVTADLGPALDLVAPASSPVGSGAQACALRAPPVPTAMGGGTVESFIDPARAQALIVRTQAQAGGKIDPDYVDNLRVAVRMDDGQRATVLVPKAMDVRVGDRVAVEGSYRNAKLPCNYIPNLVTVDLGPSPTP
jgi:hypothetical protein